jgi:large subunit ribosomal protein L4
MELAVVNTAGKETGKKVSLSAEIFGLEPNDHAIYLDVKQYLAHNRQGTHKAKERGEITGSTRKIKRQKGTGTARAGSIKSPLFRGGGRIFGPRPRNYGIDLNKKVKQLARKSALSYKAKDNAILIVDDFAFDAIKTKEYVAMLENLKLSDKKSLVVLDEANKNVYLSSRNIKKANVITLDELNTYDIMNCSNIVFSEKSLSKLQTAE